MSESEKTFQQILESLPNAIEGRIFGAKCIKTANGKAAAVLWQDSMVFKLDLQDQKVALKLKGAKMGSHFYAPEKSMKGWIEIPTEHSGKWIDFTRMAIEYVLDGTVKK